MVRGLGTFKKYFGAYPENYIVIGGTACDVIIEGADLIPRANVKYCHDYGDALGLCSASHGLLGGTSLFEINSFK